MPPWLLQQVRYVRRQHVGPVELVWRLARKMLQRLWMREEVRIYAREPQPGEGCPQFRRNCLQDLLLYEPRGRRDATVSEFLYDASARLGRGARLYTAIEGGRLVHWAWLEGSGDNMVLEGGFTQASIRQRLADAAGASGVNVVLARAPAHDTEAARNLEACGFRLREIVRRRVFLGSESISAV